MTHSLKQLLVSFLNKIDWVILWLTHNVLFLKWMRVWMNRLNDSLKKSLVATYWRNYVTSRKSHWPCPKWYTSYALSVSWTYNGCRMRVSVKSMGSWGVPIVILHFRRVSASAPFVVDICPWCSLLSQHWSELQPSDSQSGLTSRKCEPVGSV